MTTVSGTAHAAHPHPQLETERLMAIFTARGSSNEFPPQPPRLQQQLRAHRDYAVRKATEDADKIDQPFSLQELWQAKRGRDKATGVDGVTYSNAGPRRDRQGRQAAGPALRLVVGGLPAAHVERSLHSAYPQAERAHQAQAHLSLPICTAKTAEKMVLARLQWRDGPLHQNVFGFTRGMSTTDSIFALLAQVNYHSTLVIFLDLRSSSWPAHTPSSSRS